MTKVHFLGIGGSGASAAAAIAQSQGFEVTGCDKIPHNEFTTEFSNDQLLEDHDPKHLSFRPGGVPTNIDVLAVTPAIYSLDPDNPELKAAKEKGVEVLTWQQFTGKYLMKGKFVIAVCGTHGKTTTTAMIAKILEDLGESPTVILGAIVPKWGTNYQIGKQPNLNDTHVDENYVPKNFFVIEADEYNDNFLPYKPNISIVTNIEMDHPEFFKDLEDYKHSFFEFLLKTENIIIANLHDSNIAEILKDVMKETSVTSFDYSKSEYNITLKIPGKFNHLNAAAAYCVGLLLGLDPDKVKQSLESYEGVGRRFELLGEFHGARVYSDFGHHPTEIRSTMQAAREKFPDKKLWLIYEPHMFTRTKALFDDFVKVFKNLPINQVLIMDIYPSRELDTGIVSSEQLANAIDKNNVDYVKSYDDLEEIIKSETRQGDILFFMGAGDIDRFAKELVPAS